MEPQAPLLTSMVKQVQLVAQAPLEELVLQTAPREAKKKILKWFNQLVNQMVEENKLTSAHIQIQNQLLNLLLQQEDLKVRKLKEALPLYHQQFKKVDLETPRP